jgi:hypothetical protein
MAKDLFREKFEQEIKSYLENYECKFTKEMRNIAKIVGHSIHSREYGEFFQKNEKEFLESLRYCIDYELDCDAVYNLEEHIFKGNNSSISTTDCPSWEDFKAEMSDYLCDFPDRGFVYIAWRVSPLIVYYIGMTENSGGDRFNLRNHGLLSRAIEKGATKFTIIFPDRSNNIKSVEGSLIRIIKRLGHEVLNKQNESFDTYEGEIYELQKFIDKVRSCLKTHSH